MLPDIARSSSVSFFDFGITSLFSLASVEILCLKTVNLILDFSSADVCF